jgi:hypothetical protein
MLRAFFHLFALFAFIKQVLETSGLTEVEVG